MSAIASIGQKNQGYKAKIVQTLRKANLYLMHETTPKLDDPNITRLTLTELGGNLEETLKQVAAELRRVVINYQGKDIAVLVPLEDLTLIEEMEDRLDVEAAEAALAEEGENIKLADLKAELGL